MIVILRLLWREVQCAKDGEGKVRSTVHLGRPQRGQVDTVQHRVVVCVKALSTPGFSGGSAVFAASAVGVTIWSGTPSSICLLYTSPSPRDATLSRMPSSA